MNDHSGGRGEHRAKVHTVKNSHRPMRRSIIGKEKEKQQNRTSVQCQKLIEDKKKKNEFLSFVSRKKGRTRKGTGPRAPRRKENIKKSSVPRRRVLRKEE